MISFKYKTEIYIYCKLYPLYMKFLLRKLIKIIMNYLKLH